MFDHLGSGQITDCPDNGNVHRAAAKIIASKGRAARGSVCDVLLSDQRPNICSSFLIEAECLVKVEIAI